MKRSAKKKVKSVKTGSYQQTSEHLADLIDNVGSLIYDAQQNKDKIAMWGLTFIYDDLIKSFHRLQNIKTTIKGDRT